jgi:hypothetical protein
VVRSGSAELGPGRTEGSGIAGVFVRTGAVGAGPDTTMTVPADPWLAGVNVLREGAEVGTAVVGGKAAGEVPEGVKVRVAGRAIGAPVGAPSMGLTGTFVGRRASWILGSAMLSDLVLRWFSRARPDENSACLIAANVPSDDSTTRPRPMFCLGRLNDAARHGELQRS